MRETRVEEAASKMGNGYNCAQAVACTYCDCAGIDEETMYSITQGFGVGLGNMEGNCGAISGATAVLGLINKAMNDNPALVRMKTVQDTRNLADEFKKKNTTITCKELKGMDTGVIIRKCPDCIRDVCKLLEESIGGFEKIE